MNNEIKVRALVNAICITSSIMILKALFYDRLHAIGKQGYLLFICGFLANEIKV